MADLLTLLARRRVALGAVACVAALVLARPTWPSWALGFAVAGVGEVIRVWAAGHLEKSREVTTSGPYRWVRHPLYLGSSVLALGVVIASRSYVVGALAALYLGSTITAAIRAEEAFLRDAFGASYDQYARSQGTPLARPFSLERALRNKEYRAVCGLLAGFALLALRVLLPL